MERHPIFPFSDRGAAISVFYPRFAFGTAWWVTLWGHELMVISMLWVLHYPAC